MRDSRGHLSMQRRNVLAALACSWAVPAVALYDSNPADEQAILQVTREFQAALIARDGARLTALLLHPKILFSSPAAPARVQQRRAQGEAAYDGIDPNGAENFVAFVAQSKVSIEEKFYNIRVTQDRHLAWVMFDFEFLEDGKLGNRGLETWQMLKTADGSWKILSVLWSSHGAP